ncbi:hypothetical protein [Vulcanisaeta thermophila]|uniref:hypothetical protein n=1 Tax=Vulcanisaeta thermophila TaxID=867917 RepID=UPI001EE354A3|nr:hypothetical protein [Vulcanisaeta thermophila]
MMTIVLYLALAMVTIHLAGSVLSFQGRTYPRRLGIAIALYEAAFYVTIVALRLGLPTILFALAYVYLVIHVVGGALYIRGSLHQVYAGMGVGHGVRWLLYYGVYELAEMIYLTVLLITIA